MSGVGSIKVTTEEDVIRDEKLIENNDALKDLIIELRKIIEYLQIIVGEKL